MVLGESNMSLSRWALLSAILVSILSVCHANDIAERREWVRQIVLKLNAAKQFPHEALGRSGTARIAFRIDRAGHIVSTALLQSTGVDALDRDALALIKRAEPLPSPPAEVTEDELQFTVPLIYRAPVVSNPASFDDPMKASGFLKDERAVSARINGICRGC
jgi:TonB family protein